jgi:uncharacterized alkaline shock family protein YloU
MNISKRPPGKTTIAPGVLLTIARLTALEVEGVSRMYHIPSGVNRLIRRGHGEGVKIEVKDDCVFIDLHVVLKNDTNIREVSRNIQHDVTRAISEMVGMDVGYVNIHIEDIDYPSDNELEA